MRRLIGEVNGKRILDVGCKFGSYSICRARRLYPKLFRQADAFSRFMLVRVIKRPIQGRR